MCTDYVRGQPITNKHSMNKKNIKLM